MHPASGILCSLSFPTFFKIQNRTNVNNNEKTKKLTKVIVGNERAKPTKKSRSPRPKASLKKFFFKRNFEIRKLASMIQITIPKLIAIEIK